MLHDSRTRVARGRATIGRAAAWLFEAVLWLVFLGPGALVLLVLGVGAAWGALTGVGRTLPWLEGWFVAYETWAEGLPLLLYYPVSLYAFLFVLGPFLIFLEIYTKLGERFDEKREWMQREMQRELQERMAREAEEREREERRRIRKAEESAGNRMIDADRILMEAEWRRELEAQRDQRD